VLRGLGLGIELSGDRGIRRIERSYMVSTHEEQNVCMTMQEMWLVNFHCVCLPGQPGGGEGLVLVLFNSSAPEQPADWVLYRP
jgi:hypothetical protein